jgi:NAD(P)-dependent dehydrogenase (short-subunit alcohol dehydrogenase family)
MMKLNGNGNRVLVTGATRGIGREIAGRLARRGLHVFVPGRDSKVVALSTEAIQALGGSADGLGPDVSDSASIRQAATEFSEGFDRLDVLINNAGIYPDKGLSILTVPRERLTETFQTNTFGPVEVVQQFLALLRMTEGARIINISSGYGQLGGLSPNVPSYCLSTLTLNGVTIMLAAALAADEIAVNSVCPGWVRTDMGGPDATRSVEEGADTAVWLATDAEQHLTGRFFRDRSEIPW